VDKNLLRRGARLIGKLWAIVGLLLLVGLLLDGAAYLWLKQRTPERLFLELQKDAENSQSWVSQYRSELASLIDSDYQWQDFVMWRNRPFSGAHIHVGEDLVRHSVSPDVPAPPQGKRISIFMFGGSTLWGWGSRDAHTIPSELLQRLRRSGVDASVTNFATNGYFSTQELFLLVRQLQSGSKADLVIFLDGLNESLTALTNDGRVGDGLGFFRRQRLFANRFYRSVATIFEQAWRSSALAEALSAKSSGRTLPVEPLAEQIASTYHTNMRALEALGQEFQFRPMVFWQPTISSKKQLSSVEQRSLSVAPPDLVKNRSVMLRVSQRVREEMSRDPAFHDIGGMFDDSSETIYPDYMHYTEAANARIADRMAAAIMLTIEPSKAQ
jgi:lysophospholipase L1-like esterase